jgi:hypothetical protein
VDSDAWDGRMPPLRRGGDIIRLVNKDRTLPERPRRYQSWHDSPAVTTCPLGGLLDDRYNHAGLSGCAPTPRRPERSSDLGGGHGLGGRPAPLSRFATSPHV